MRHYTNPMDNLSQCRVALQDACQEIADLKAKLAEAEAERDKAKEAAHAAFVAGADWARFEITGFTSFQSERDEASEAAEKRFPYIPRAHLELLREAETENAALKAKLAALVEAVEYAVDFVNHSSCMPMCGLYRTPPTECTCGIDGIRAALAAAKDPHPVQPSPADLVQSTQDGPHPAVGNPGGRHPELKVSKAKESQP